MKQDAQDPDLPENVKTLIFLTQFNIIFNICLSALIQSL